MAKQTSVWALNGSRVAIQTIGVADTTTKKDLVSAGANDSVIRSIVATSLDTSAVTLELYLYDGTTDALLKTFTIQPVAGSAGAAPVDMMALPSMPVDSRGNKIILLPAGSKLKVKAVATVGDTVSLSVFLEDY